MPKTIDHFRAYSLDPESVEEIRKPIQVRGQFDIRDLPPPHLRKVMIHGPAEILNPTDKMVEHSWWPWPEREFERQHREDHLLWYHVERGADETERKALVTNQFYPDPVWINVGALVAFLAPASKSHTPDGEPSEQLPRELDHYEVYNIDGGPAPGVKIRLADQFDEGGSRYTAGQPLFFGVPADKLVDGEETRRTNGDAHLVFFRLDDQGPKIRETRNARDQFGKHRFTTTRSSLLAVPTAKKQWDHGHTDLDADNADYLRTLHRARAKQGR